MYVIWRGRGKENSYFLGEKMCKPQAHGVGNVPGGLDRSTDREREKGRVQGEAVAVVER